jgi:hypothetical protein
VRANSKSSKKAEEPSKATKAEQSDLAEALEALEKVRLEKEILTKILTDKLVPTEGVKDKTKERENKEK